MEGDTTAIKVTAEQVHLARATMDDLRKPLCDRFRALFTLKNAGGPLAIESIAKVLDVDDSALMKHECAYCLGQMKDPDALPVLIRALIKKDEHPMVRHEAAEAIGAIGMVESLDILKEYLKDPVKEVAETCELAIQRIQWLEDQRRQKGDQQNGVEPPSRYMSVDPAPPLTESTDVNQLKELLVDESKPLFLRYRAMFRLRDIGSDDAIRALASGLKCQDSALFRHEIAYVLGQIQSPVCIEELKSSLQDKNENEMVRHECAEALGSIATPEAEYILKYYLNDEQRVVKESVYVALDMADYEKSDQFLLMKDVPNSIPT